MAAANGLDLQKAFGTQLPTWFASINKGESIDTYKKMIRDVAKIGMPQNIATLLDNGIDLDAVYSPYKNVMASVLEINPESITLNDPILRSAITGEKELPIYEFHFTSCRIKDMKTSWVIIISPSHFIWSANIIDMTII